jgi:hypothetical protein
MFEWIKGKNKMPSNVVPFPKSVKIPQPDPGSESKTFYSIGITDNARVSLKVGEHTTLILNRTGLTNLINQLETFRNQLPDE